MGCTEVYAQCCTALGRFRQGQDALQVCLEKVGPSSGERQPTFGNFGDFFMEWRC